VEGGVVVWPEVVRSEGDNEIHVSATFGAEKRSDACIWKYVAPPTDSAATK